MQIPETPTQVADLDLMRRLKMYAQGVASWGGAPLGDAAMQACDALHTGLVNLIQNGLAPILDRTTARELETFTMHDRRHGHKVAHLMWHILENDRRNLLTPPEIGMLVGSAFLHDAGLALSPDERQQRLAPESDLWERLEVEPLQRSALDTLRAQSRDTSLPEPHQRRAEYQLFQAQEVLLSQDTRERHGTRQRYEEVLSVLASIVEADPTNVPNVRAVFAFQGDSFMEKLIQVCVSHNQDAETLVERDEEDFALPRFPRDYPVGSCVVDIHLVAAALRLGDILDFDRERTPAVLFHYLMPGPLTAALENRSILEWGKHLAISNWYIESEAIIFKGRCRSHVIHHAVVQFAAEIQREIEVTRATFGTLRGGTSWPFQIPRAVQVAIVPEGYTYVPYRFELDDERVYTLLMGGAIYDNPLVAIRELIQNAIDACLLRDALKRLHEPESEPKVDNRLKVTYKDPIGPGAFPTVIISDTGTGMDGWVIERFFLKVGRSFYRSAEFNRTSFELRKRGFIFTPISEFGIGFLSCFLLADQVLVETAMWESIRGDTRKRSLTIDGPTRLIRMNEQENSGPGRFRGTRITLTLTRGGRDSKCAPTWTDISEYIKRVCRDLPYPMTLEHVSNDGTNSETLQPRGSHLELSSEIESIAHRIPVVTEDVIGEVVILGREPSEKQTSINAAVSVTSRRGSRLALPDELRRGGFLVGEIPGLPQSPLIPGLSGGILNFKPQPSSRHFRSTNVARNAAADQNSLGLGIAREWLRFLMANPDLLLPRTLSSIVDPTWRRFVTNTSSASDQLWEFPHDGLDFYHLARAGWSAIVPLRWIRRWEDAEISMLRIPDEGDYFSSLAHRMLRHTLAAVGSRMINGRRGLFISSPAPGWRELLKAHTGQSLFRVDYAAHWGNFAVYRPNISALLAYQSTASGTAASYVRFFNEAYADRFLDFSTDEVALLIRLVDRLIDAARGGEPREFEADEWDLLLRAGSSMGDLDIGWAGKTLTLGVLLSSA